LGDGTYEAVITAPVAVGVDTISAIVVSGVDTVSIFWKAELTYVNPVSINENFNSPDRFYLYQNSPNPFNPTTIIKYQIPKSGFVSLKVFDVLGNEVETLVNKEKSAGTYELVFDATDLSSGIYFYKLQAGDFTATKKMIVIK
jgi:hypothetical protein